MKRVVLVAACIAFAVGGISSAQQMGHDKMKTERQTMGTSGTMARAVEFVPSEAKWSPGPNMLPSGAEIVVIEGDPTKSGPFTLQLKFPDGYKITPHWHASDERLTVVQGSLAMGMGERWSDDGLKTFTAGGYVYLPKKNPHYVEAKNEVIVQVEGTGPFDVTYINPSDDPRKK